MHPAQATKTPEPSSSNRATRRLSRPWLLLLFLLVGIMLTLGLTTPAQAQEQTLREFLTEQYSNQGLSGPLIEQLLQALPAELLEQPASSYAGSGDPTQALLDAYALLSAGQNVNDAGALCQIGLGGAYTAAFTASFFEPPPLIVADYSAYTANLALKYCTPVLRAPDDLGLEPDGPNEPEACRATIDDQLTYERTGKIFFADFGSREQSWGALGTPYADHYNTGMGTQIERIVVGNRIENEFISGWDPFRADIGEGNPPARQTFELGVGRNTVTWGSYALADTLDLFYLYIPGIPAGWKAPFTKKIKNGAVQAAVDVGVDIAAALAAEVAIASTDDLFRDFPISYASVDQTVEVYDRIAPTIETSIAAFQFEGTVLGGASAQTAAYATQLRDAITFSDACGAQVELVPPPYQLWPVDQTTPVVWRALDSGPNPDSPRADRRNESSVTQLVTVVDTLAPVIRPPDGVIVEAASATSVELTPPQIFDFVDANPSISNDAPTAFPVGTTNVEWTVVDQSGNTSTAFQTVSIKVPGTNIAPTAEPLSSSAQSFTPLELILRGDDIDGDPLRFRISEPPANGFFVAPLLPYFVGDLRKPVDAGITGDGCGRDADQIWEPTYVAIDDEDRSFVLNAPIDCAGGFEDRITVLDRDGNFLVGRDMPRSTTLEGLSIDLESGYIAYLHDEIVSIDPTEIYSVVSKLDLDTLETLVEIQSPAFGSGEFSDQGWFKGVFDDRDFFYATITNIENRGKTNVYDLRGLEAAPGTNRILLSQGDEVGSYYLTEIGFSPPTDIVLDSERNLYVSTFRQVHKFTPVRRVDADALGLQAQLGEQVGWLGACTQGPGCDVARGTSRGFSCNDTNCGGANAPLGTLPGQFASTGGIAVDPNDILYVTDFGNDRIQRFTSDGYFAGQAKTSCGADEACFVRSEFSRPRALSVNSKRFHVLDTDADVLYMFDTSVVEPLYDPSTGLVDSARVVYQSDSGFTGTDLFSFRVGDGLAESAPQEVSISVSRGFHPPTAQDMLETVDQGTATPIFPLGFDPDFVFDTLTYTVVEGPSHGVLSAQTSGTIGSFDRIVYTSDVDFAGVDTIRFVVSDGTTVSAPATITLEVVDVGQLAVFEPYPDVVRAGLGYPFEFNALFSDADPSDTHYGIVIWGDGTQDEGGDITFGGSGRFALRATHTYAQAGSYELIAVTYDPDYRAFLTPRPTVIVEEMADLRVGIRDLNGTGVVGEDLTYIVRVEHIAPDATITSGIQSAGGEVAILLPASLDVVELPTGASCTAGTRDANGVLAVSCPLAPMAPGAVTELPVVLRANAAGEDAFSVEVTTTTPDPTPLNLAIVQTRIDPAPVIGQEDSVLVGGIAVGGEWVRITLAGREVALLTNPLEGSTDFLERLAAAIEGDSALSALGVMAEVRGSRLTTNTEIEGFIVDDPGLFEGVLVGFERARLTIDLDYLGAVEIEQTPGLVLMSPTGRIAILPSAFGTEDAFLAQPPAADPFQSVSLIGASNQEGVFETIGSGDFAGEMPLAGTMRFAMAGEPLPIDRSLATVGTSLTDPPASTGLDVRFASSPWTTGTVSVQSYFESTGSGPLETFTGADERGPTQDEGLVRMVSALEVDVYRDGVLEETVPGFAELEVVYVPEPETLPALMIALAAIALAGRSRSRARELR